MFEGEMKKKGGILFGKEKDEITIRSSAAEYLPPMFKQRRLNFWLFCA